MEAGNIEEACQLCNTQKGFIANVVNAALLRIAKKTKQLPDYTRNRGLDKAKLQQMILQYLQNAGSAGAKRDAIFDYLKDVLPKTKTSEQQEWMVGNILVEMKDAGIIILKGKIWYMK